MNVRKQTARSESFESFTGNARNVALSETRSPSVFLVVADLWDAFVEFGFARLFPEDEDFAEPLPAVALTNVLTGLAAVMTEVGSTAVVNGIAISSAPEIVCRRG